MFTTRTLQILWVALIVASARLASGQCTFEWNPGQPLAGVNGVIYASIVHDDGAGPKLYIGGAFGLAVDTRVHGLASFDGTSWSPEAGLEGARVYAFAEFDGDLYAGGQLNHNGESVSVLRWDGQT